MNVALRCCNNYSTSTRISLRCCNYHCSCICSLSSSSSSLSSTMLLPSFVVIKAARSHQVTGGSGFVDPLFDCGKKKNRDDHLVVASSPPNRPTRRRRSSSSSSRRRTKNGFAAAVLLFAAMPQQAHAKSPCDCQFDHACFPADGLLLKTAVNAFTAVPSTWNGTIGEVNYGSNASEWCTGLVTNMQGLFKDKANFDEDLSLWNTASVTIMEEMFKGASSFTGAGIGLWNVSSVSNMYRMFAHASSFTGDGIGSWDVASVQSMKMMFLHASSFTGGDGIGSWDVASVKDMVSMFRDTSFTGDGIGLWDVSSVTAMGYMFSIAPYFNQNLCSWRNNFPYNNSIDIFVASGCTFKADPVQANGGPFCAEDDCPTTDFPTSNPTSPPSQAPSKSPTADPTSPPSQAPSKSPTTDPTEQPTPNPTPAIPSWLVQHNSTIADFNKSSGDEITLEYLIGKGREPRVTLFQSGCENPLFDSDGITLGTEPATTDIADDPNHSKYQVYLDVIKNATVLGDQYANGILSFCVLLELLSGGTPIKSDKTEVAITLNFNNTFEIKDVNLTQIYVGSDSIATTVLEYVEACACYDHQDGECNPNPVITGGRDDDKVKVCIKSTSPEMEIDYLDRLVLEGNDPAELLDIVTTGENWDSATASLVKAPLWNGVYVAGVVPDSYYSYSQDVIAKVTGVVYLKLAGSSRRRIAVELDVDADAGHDGSKVIADAASGRSARALQSAVDVEQQQESAFAVNFALQKTSELEQLGDADVNGATATGAGAWMSAGLIPAAAVVIGSTSAAVASIMMW